jgi:hypothetical protein
MTFLKHLIPGIYSAINNRAIEGSAFVGSDGTAWDAV